MERTIQLVQPMKLAERKLLRVAVLSRVMRKIGLQTPAE